MPRAFDHYLHILLPCPESQLPESHQLLDLRRIRGIIYAARPAGIPKAYSHVIFPADIQKLIVILKERILISRHLHPGINDGTASGHYIHFPLVALKLSGSLAVYAAVDSKKIHSVLCVKPHHIQPLLSGDLFKFLLVINKSIINRHRAQHGRAS